MIRLIFSFLTIFLFLAGMYSLALIIYLILAFKYAGFELILIGILVDGYYNAFTSVPVYTLSALGIWSFSLLIRRWLIVYNNEHALPS